MQKNNGKWKRLKKKRFSDNEYYFLGECFKTDKCYQFTIKDKKKDGICCEHGSGFYEINFDGINIRRQFQKGKKKVETFGNCASKTPKVSGDAYLLKNVVDGEKY